MAAVARRAVYKAGEIIYTEDRGGGSVYIIASGVVRITKVVRFDERQTLSLLQQGDFFGEISFMDRHPHSASAEAAQEAELIVISRDAFDELAASDPALALKVMRQLALELATLLRKMDERFVELVNYLWGQGKV
jgi:CRP-like cAMP-binding protein